jgi:hypothetical protein
MMKYIVADGTVHALLPLRRLAKERAMIVEKSKSAGWFFAALLGGVAVCAPGCSPSSSTSTDGLDSGMHDAIAAVTPTRESGAPPLADAGSGNACNTCANAAYAAGGACGSFVTACVNDSACKTLATCANLCAASDTTCLDNCAAAATTVALNEYQALFDCICGSACTAQCAAGCGTGPDSGTTPVDSGSRADGTSGDRCAAAGCPTLTTMPVDFTSYCPNAPGTMRVCDCPGAGPPAPCTTATQGANLYCCP